MSYTNKEIENLIYGTITDKQKINRKIQVGIAFDSDVLTQLDNMSEILNMNRSKIVNALIYYRILFHDLDTIKNIIDIVEELNKIKVTNTE